MNGRPNSRLLWRFYAVGLLQLVLAIAVGGLLVALVNHWTRRSDLADLQSRVAAVVHSRAQLQAELDRLRRRDGVLVTLYDSRGAVRATNHDGSEPFGGFPGRRETSHPPLPREPSAPPLVPPPPGAPPVSFARIDLGGGEQGLLEARFRPLPPSLAPVGFALLAGVVVVGLGAVLSARFVAKPLARLTSAARAFGAGDLRARAESPPRDELGDVLTTFNEMADRIQSLVAAEKELLANVAHELRTPLARIRVALELAAEGDAQTAQELTNDIASDLRELETLVDDVLSTARFEATSGRASEVSFAMQPEVVPPSLIVKQSSERFRARHPARELRVDAEPNLPLLEIDAKLTRRVLDNLLENADKYTPEPRAPIELRARRRATHVVFEVEDRGLGISEADLPQVFSAFFRAERSRSRRSGGVGLGLTLCKRIVEAHGGTITLESKLGVGTTVRVELPSFETSDGNIP